LSRNTTIPYILSVLVTNKKLVYFVQLGMFWNRIRHILFLCTWEHWGCSVASLAAFQVIWACFFWKCGFFSYLRVAYILGIALFACCLFSGWFPSGFSFVECLFSKLMELSLFHFAVKHNVGVFLFKFGYLRCFTDLPTCFCFNLLAFVLLTFYLKHIFVLIFWMQNLFYLRFACLHL